MYNLIQYPIYLFFRCNVLWYTAPLSSQKILLFLMHRTIKSLRPSLFNMFVASLEGFVKVMYIALKNVNYLKVTQDF